MNTEVIHHHHHNHCQDSNPELRLDNIPISVSGFRYSGDGHF